MTTQPGAQNQPFEALVTASSTEQHESQPEAALAALRVQILSTEHSSLLAPPIRDPEPAVAGLDPPDHGR